MIARWSSASAMILKLDTLKNLVTGKVTFFVSQSKEPLSKVIV